MHLCTSSSNAPRLPLWNCYKTLRIGSLFTRCRIPCTWHTNDTWTSKSGGPNSWCFLRHVLRATTAFTFWAPRLKQVLRAWCSFWIIIDFEMRFVHFLNISSSKSAPTLVCFVRFYFDMCFAPQQRALFYITTFKSAPALSILCVFAPQQRAVFEHFNITRLPKVLRAWRFSMLPFKCASRHNAVRFFNISTSKMLWSWGALYILTWECTSRHKALHAVLHATAACKKCPENEVLLAILTSKSASRHNGMHLISQQTNWLRTRRFSEPTFQPSGATKHSKNMEQHSVSRLSYLFLHLHFLSSFFCLFWLFLFSAFSHLRFFHLSILPEVWLLNFLRS